MSQIIIDDTMHLDIQADFGMISEQLFAVGLSCLLNTETNLKACTVTYIYIYIYTIYVCVSL